MNEINLLQEATTRCFARMHELAEHDAEIAALLPKKEIQDETLRPGLSNSQIVDIVLRGYADRPALRERRYEIGAYPESGRASRRYLPMFEGVTYRELRERIEAVANAWRHHPRHGTKIDQCICIIGSTGIDFVVIDLATAYAQTVTMPLQMTTGAEHLETIIKDTEPASVFATIADLAAVTRLVVKHGGIRSLVAFDYDPRVDAERAIFEASQAELRKVGAVTELTTLQALIDFGRQYSWTPPAPHPQGLGRLAGLMHSSGSTGTPKGVMISEQAMNLGWLGTGAPQMPIVMLAFAPMNHFMGRHQVYNTLTTGGIAYFTVYPDLSTLFEDIRIARPTFQMFFPRVFELVYQYYQGEIVRRSGEGRDVAEVDAEIRAEMKQGFLGDRLRGGTIGSAPTSQEVRDFMRDCFDIMLLDGYGSTESGVLTTMGNVVMRSNVIDYQLRDVPELGYYSSDKPYPRGELFVKSKSQALGYFKRPEATAEVFGADGYVATGDIMEERGPDCLVYVDRRNDVLKLSQAEFVAVGPLGTVFEGGSPVIKQIHIYGNSARAYLLAVVVPDMEVAAEMIGHSPTESELKQLIRAEIQRVAQEAKLRTFEVPRDFIIEPEPFSIENGLLTSVRKRSRAKLKAKYGERLEAIYTEIERKRQEEMQALKDPDSSLTILQKVVKALEGTLGIEGIDPDTTKTFSQLGGDSLGSVGFSMFIEDVFGVEIPVNAIVSPAGNPRRWAQMIERALSDGAGEMPTFGAIHGKDARVLRARDLDVERFLDRKTLDSIPTAPPPSQALTVLLTGANGFLGRFLCLAWMQQVAPLGGKVICLIRAGSDEAARKRLDEVFIGVDPELERDYRALAANHLEVLAGDIAEPGFGLASGVWERLADEVDHIVHPAALVNHMLSYDHLFGPNVAGTAELIRLALTRRQKGFDFVSSIAAAYRVETRASGFLSDEDSPLLDELPLGDGYADGYGASKWANEVQLHSAHRRYGLPVNIFRGDMMMPHRRYKGQINVPDMFTRMLYSVVMTGLAPISFYEPGPDGRRAHAHYDGMPVDVLAGAMTGIGARSHRDIRTYNTINYHFDDGVSLDNVVDWIASAGYAVERVRDHGDWLKQFGSKLRALTEAQRQHSSLAIIDMFKRPYPARSDEFGAKNFIAAIRDLPIGPEVPHLTERYIHKYLDDMRLLGLLPDAKKTGIA